jgi:hypothetical protein
MAIDRGILDEQLQQLGEPSRWWDLRELRDLPSVLEPDERILAIARGKVARVRWMRRPWLIVVTGKRLICIRSGGRKSWRQIEVDVRQIMRVALRVGPFRGRVVVLADGRKYRLLVPRTDAYKLHTAILGVAPAYKPTSARFAPTRLAGRIVDHMLALPAVAFDPQTPEVRTLPAPRDTAAEERRKQQVLEMEVQMQQLRDQVDFLEQLLSERNLSQIPASSFDE